MTNRGHVFILTTSLGQAPEGKWLSKDSWDRNILTKTSRLLAILLGRLRMTMDECVKAYARLFADSFPRSRRRFFLQSQPKLNSHILEESISQIVQEYAPAAIQRGQEDIFASDPMQCKTAVLSFAVKSGKPFLFRTYGLSDRKGTKGNTRSDEKITWNIKSTPLGPNDKPEQDRKENHASLLRIAHAAKATSAAPTYFKPFHVDSQTYVDGGSAANNPSLLIYSELKQIHGKAVHVEKESDPGQEYSESSSTFIEAFVSIGASKERTSDSGAQRDFTRSILRRNSDLRHKLQAFTEIKSVSSNETDRIMQSLTQMGEIEYYFRLISDPSSSILSWEDWLKIRKKSRQASFNLSPDPKRHQCASKLVDVKREREATGQWTSFAGPLCYSRGQISAESSDSRGLGSVREASNKSLRDTSTHVRLFEAEYLEAREGLNSPIDATISDAPFPDKSSRRCAFVWRVPEFYNNLKTPKTPDCFNNIVTINRICGDNYWACTCISFIESCWPDLDVSILRTISRICQVLFEKDAFQEDNIKCGSLSINARATASLLVFEPAVSQAQGDASPTTSAAFRLFVDCIRWLICALMPNDGKKGIFLTNMVSVSKPQVYVIAFKSFKPRQDDCYCWTGIFSYACVIDLNLNVEQPSILTDSLSKIANNEPAGLRMDYDLIWELAGIEETRMYKEALVLRGFDTALVPLQGGDWPDHSRWHLWRTPGKMIKMEELDVKSGHEKVIDLERFKGKLVYVGWVVESKFLLGTNHSATASDLRGSHVDTVGMLKEKSQQAAAFQLQLPSYHGLPGVGVHRQQNWNYGSTLKAATRSEQYEVFMFNQLRERRVILYDEDTKNATLVPPIALLMFATLRYIRHFEYTHFRPRKDSPTWESITTLRLPPECYDIGDKCKGVFLDNDETELSQGLPAQKVVSFRRVVYGMYEAIDAGNNASRKEISKKRRSNKKALYGFDLREAIRTEDIYFRRLKCTASMKVWAAAAEQTDVIFVNGLGALIVPACDDCMTTPRTYPGLLNGTVSSLEREYSRNLWEPNDQHRRIKNTNSQWIIHGKPFAQCKHQDPAATTTCDDISRIQTISQNSKFTAVFHRRQELKSQLNVVSNVWSVMKEGMWSRKVWSDTCPDWELRPKGAVRFGKVCRCAWCRC